MAKSKFFEWLKKAFTTIFRSNYWGWFNLAIVSVVVSLIIRVFPNFISNIGLWKISGIIIGLSLFWEMLKFILFVGMLGKKASDVYGTNIEYVIQIIGNILLAQFGYFIALL